MTNRESTDRAASCTVWLARLPDSTDHLVAVLDAVERQRRARFRLVADRDRFTVGAALLRFVVAEHFGSGAGDVGIDRTCPDCNRQHGRPRVVCGDEAQRVDVSVAHAGQVVAVALTTIGRVGVDVEVIPSSFAELADIACSADERRRVRSARDFATVWVRKESVLKAVGIGLRRAPSTVRVSAPDSPAALLHFDEVEPTCCHMADLQIDGVHAGAISVVSDQQVALAVRDAQSFLQGATQHRS